MGNLKIEKKLYIDKTLTFIYNIYRSTNYRHYRNCRNYRLFINKQVIANGL